MEVVSSRSQETRERLIAAATTLFSERGFADTGLDEVVGAAGVSKGAFYHHFRAKTDLLRVIHERIVEEAFSVSQTSDDPPTAIGELIKNLLLVTARFRAEMTIFYREWHLLDDETSALVRSSRRRYEDLWAKTIRDGIEAGVFRSDVEPRSVVYALIGMCVWTYQWMREATEDEVERLASDFTKVALGGLAT